MVDKDKKDVIEPVREWHLSNYRESELLKYLIVKKIGQLGTNSSEKSLFVSKFSLPKKQLLIMIMVDDCTGHNNDNLTS